MAQKQFLRFALALGGGFGILGCASTVTHVAPVTFAAVPIERVSVLYSEPQKPHIVLSLVSYEAPTRFESVRDAIEQCRRLAAASGADAIVIVSTRGQGGVNGATASGKAIKWTQ